MKEIIKFILENPVVIGLASAGIIFIIVIVALIIYFNRKDRDNFNNIITSLTTPRIFVCNLKDDEVTYFDRGVYHKQKKGPMSQFYHQFTARSIDDLEKWIQALLTPKSGVTLYHEIDVFVKSERRSYVSLLEVIKIDYAKKVIHLESYLYRYLRPTNQINNRQRRRDKVGYMIDAELAKLYKRRFSRDSGCYAAISIVNKTVTKNSKTEIPPHIVYELRNKTAIHRSKTVILHFTSQNSVGIYMPFSSSSEELIKIVKDIISRTEGYFELNGEKDFSLAAGVVGHDMQFSDLEIGIKTAEELSDFAHHEKNQILIYSPSRETKDLDLSVYRSEVAQIVSHKKIEPLFQPLLSATSAEIHGYLVSYGLNSPLFSSYPQLANFVLENKEVDSFAQMVIRKSSASYYNKRRNGNHKIFLPLDVEEYPSFEKVAVKQSYLAELKFVFIITEDSFSKNFSDVADMVKFVTRVKDNKHEVALLIHDTELSLPDDLYSNVDYFMVDETIVEAANKDQRELLYLLASLGKLLRHKKKIVITGISKWSEIEYYIRAGVDYIASNEISKKDGNLQTIEKKKALRIINFSRRV